MSGVDVLLVTALQVEFAAAQTTALAGYGPHPGVASWQACDSDTTAPYLLGEYCVADGRSFTVALARATRMGAIGTSSVAVALVERLHPRCLAMCGVCAGNPKDVALGDVVIAEMAYQYDEGALNIDGFAGDHRQFPISEPWLRAAQELSPTDLPAHGAASEEDAKIWLLERLLASSDPRSHPARARYFPDGTWRTRLESMEADGLIERPGAQPVLTDSGRNFALRAIYDDVQEPIQLPFATHVGPIASGNMVVKDGQAWNRLRKWGVRTVLGVEMEAASIAAVAHRHQLPHWLVAKGVMDHASIAKDDRFKGFAARASAEVLWKFLVSRLDSQPDLRNEPTPNTQEDAAPPLVWNVPAKSPVFTGRQDLLARLRDSLLTRGAAAIHALHGMGGVGKTVLALEYAHQFANKYKTVWWINAERPELIGEQLAILAVESGVAGQADAIPKAIDSVRTLFRSRDDWLVLLDNAPSAAEVAKWIPQGSGHVIITSRSPSWTGLAYPLSIDVFTRAESVIFLRGQVPNLTEAEADTLAERLGDLPLALAQAAGSMSETGIPVTEYVDVLAKAAGRVLEDRPPVGYSSSLAATVRVSMEHLSEDDQAAAQLAQLLALFGPEPVPLWLVSSGAERLPSPLGQTASDIWALRQCVGLIARYGLVQVGDAVLMHRLTQAVIRDGLSEDEHAAGRARVEALLIAARPDDGNEPQWWPRWGQMMPHILATDPATTSNRDMMAITYEGVWHLHARGDYTIALPIAEDLYRRWRDAFGEDDRHVLLAAENIGHILRELGHYERARRLDEDIVARRIRTLGRDHHETLNAATDLAADLRALGDHEAAWTLDEETYQRFVSNLGADNRDALHCAHNLATDLRLAGQFVRAYELDVDTIERRKRTMGPEHPNTLRSTTQVGSDLRCMGEIDRAIRTHQDNLELCRRVVGDDHLETLLAAHELAEDYRKSGLVGQAQRLDEDTLSRRRRLLGPDHPDTLASAHNLATDLKELGQVDRARELAEDTYNRRRRVLGASHPDTLVSAATIQR